MGLFKSKEEKEAERRQKERENEQLVQKIADSPMTRQLQAFIIEQFGDLDTEEVGKLRQLAAGGGRAGYLMEVQNKGILFNLINRKGESLDKWAITFDALGYQDLPSAGVHALQKILLQTLNSIPHLMVLDTGFLCTTKIVRRNPGDINTQTNQTWMINNDANGHARQYHISVVSAAK